MYFGKKKLTKKAETDSRTQRTLTAVRGASRLEMQNGPAVAGVAHENTHICFHHLYFFSMHIHLLNLIFQSLKILGFFIFLRVVKLQIVKFLFDVFE